MAAAPTEAAGDRLQKKKKKIKAKTHTYSKPRIRK